jgi:hypothetical protein
VPSSVSRSRHRNARAGPSVSALGDRKSHLIPTHHAATQDEDISETGRAEHSCCACGALVGLADEHNRHLSQRSELGNAARELGEWYIPRAGNMAERA